MAGDEMDAMDAMDAAVDADAVGVVAAGEMGAEAGTGAG